MNLYYFQFDGEGTPIAAVGVGEESPPGTVIEGKPVTAPRAQLRVRPLSCHD